MKVILFLFIYSFSDYDPSIIDGWLPLQLPADRITSFLESYEIEYTTNILYEQNSRVIHVTIEDNDYIYFVDRDLDLCFLVVKEYPSNQLPRRMRELNDWEQLNEQELTWYNDTFVLFRVVASINTWEGRFSISYNAESR